MKVKEEDYLGLLMRLIFLEKNTHWNLSKERFWFKNSCPFFVEVYRDFYYYIQSNSHPIYSKERDSNVIIPVLFFGNIDRWLKLSIQGILKQGL